VLLLFYLKFRAPRNCNLELSASWGFDVRADAVGGFRKAAALSRLLIYNGFFSQSLNSFHLRLSVFHCIKIVFKIRMAEMFQ
jgi:hypothetical protein